MDRRDFLKKCAAVGAGGFVLSNRTLKVRAGAKKPNIVFIMIDDMGARDVGFMGSEYYETPNIDELVGEGMVFTNAYANAANCAPTRACFLTGQYSPRHGVYTVGNSARGSSSDRRLIPIANDTTLDSHHITIAEVLKPAGYVSVSIGKWHMGTDPDLGPIGQGFDVNVGGFSAGSPPGGYFSPYKNPELPNGPDGEYLTDRLTDEALKFIDANKDRPFFLYMTHYAVHTPIQAKADLIAKYQDKPPSHGQDNPKYAAMIDSVDQGIGRMMDKLDELELTDNTVVFFFSDNGGYVGATSNQPLRGFKGTFYEGGIREPMFVKWPGVVKPGTTCDTPVISTDFFPTILEMAGAKKPPGKTLDGESIVTLLKRQTTLNREAIFWHFPAYLQGNVPGARDSKFRTRPVAVVRKGGWKLLLFLEEWVLDGGQSKIDTNNAVELYNLADDISETNNLANTNKAKRDELLNLLIDWQNSVGAPVPTTPNPDYSG
ncbi:MAG: sulfatase-like hydrolase/transferase [Planctomycetes bacterium]|nr:sulfatase-like hydrolase/transferase [Planctomycetota bacterium]